MIGGHSLLAMKLLNAIKQATGVQLPLRAVFTHSTPELLAQALDSSLQGIKLEFNPLLPLRSSGHALPLFCVHPGGGIATAFLNLARAIEPGRPVWALQAKGLEEDETPHKDIEEMTTSYLAAIRKVQPRGPYHLLGWSQGGLIAHEMAIRLEQAGETVALLALLDTTPAHESQPEQDFDDDLDAFIQKQLIDFSGLTQDQIPETYGGRLKRLYDDAVAYEFIPETTTVEWVERLFKQMMLVPHQSKTYQTGICHTPIVVFHATLEPGFQSGQKIDWQPYTSNTVTEYEIETRHMTMCQPSTAAKIAQLLNTQFIQT